MMMEMMAHPSGPRIEWINTAALANDVDDSSYAANGRRYAPCALATVRENFAGMFSDGPAFLVQEEGRTAIRWSCGLSYRDPPRGSYRLADEDRERRVVALRLASPLRCPADQRDAAHLPLFVAALEPTLL